MKREICVIFKSGRTENFTILIAHEYYKARQRMQEDNWYVAKDKGTHKDREINTEKERQKHRRRHWHEKIKHPLRDRTDKRKTVHYLSIN